MNKLNACGIVVEYNPLHTGHIHHIEESRKKSGCDVLIAVMSPYFVQRGDIAIVSPTTRATSAIQQGVDLVIELPYPYCSEHADKFAYGAIKVLNYLNIDSLCFGSESNDIEFLKQQLFVSETQEAQKAIPKKNQSMAASNPNDYSNDILGLAYLKALRTTDIKPLTIQRTNAYRSEHIKSEHASASALRRAFYNHSSEQDIAQYTPLYKAMKQDPLPSLVSHYPTIRQLLCTQSPDYLKTMFLMDEGIEGLFIKQARKHDNYEDFVSACTSKRYTKARITRTLTHLLLQTTKERANELERLEFVRILAMNETGQRYLRQLKEQNKNKLASNEANFNNVNAKEVEEKQNEITTSITFVSRFNQLPLLYQEEIKKHLYVVYSKANKQQFEKAMQQELSYPIFVGSRTN